MMKNRRLDLDLLRIIACFLVVFNHQTGYKLYQVSGTGLKAWLYMIPTMITRINVPLFFMISGTLLLASREEKYSEIIKKRFLRILFALILFTGLLQIVELCKEGGTFSIYKFVLYVIGEPAAIGGGPYWYLYCYLGFVLFLPLLRRMISGITKEDFVLILILHFVVVSFLPILNTILGAYNIESIVVGSDFVDSIVISKAKFLFFPILGYYVDRKIEIDRIGEKHIFCLTGLAITGIAVSCACTMYEGTHGKMVFTQNYVQLFDYITAVWAFLIIKIWVLKRFNDNCPERLARIIADISGLTLGIYLFDPVFKKIFCTDFYMCLEPHLGTLCVSVIWCILSMLFGGTVTYMLKKIPLIKKIF